MRPAIHEAREQAHRLVGTELVSVLASNPPIGKGTDYCDRSIEAGTEAFACIVDCQLARYVKQQAEEQHLPFYEVDGSRSLAEMTDLVERHFDPYLIECFRRMKERSENA